MPVGFRKEWERRKKNKRMLSRGDHKDKEQVPDATSGGKEGYDRSVICLTSAVLLCPVVSSPWPSVVQL